MNNETNENKELDEILSIDEIKNDIENYFYFIEKSDLEPILTKIKKIQNILQKEEMIKFFVNKFNVHYKTLIDDIRREISNEDFINRAIDEMKEEIESIKNEIKSFNIIDSNKVDEFFESSNIYNFYKEKSQEQLELEKTSQLNNIKDMIDEMDNLNRNYDLDSKIKKISDKNSKMEILYKYVYKYKELLKEKNYDKSKIDRRINSLTAFLEDAGLSSSEISDIFENTEFNVENISSNDIEQPEVLSDNSLNYSEEHDIDGLTNDIINILSSDEKNINLNDIEYSNTNNISISESSQNEFAPEDQELINLTNDIREIISSEEEEIVVNSELYNIVKMIQEDPLRNEVIDKIKAIDNYEEKIGIFNMYVLKLKDIIKEKNLDELGIERKINNTRKILKDYGNLSDYEIENIFKNSEFNIDSILSDIDKEDDFILDDSEVEEYLKNEHEHKASYNKVQMIKDLEEFGIDELHNREEFINCYEELKNNINKAKNEKIANVKLIDKQLNELKKQIENLEQNKYKDLTFKELLKLYQEIYKEKAEKQSKNENIDEVEFKLKEVSDEINRTLTNPKTKEQLEQEYEKLLKQQKQFQSSYDKKIDNLIKKSEKLNNLFNLLTGLELSKIAKEYNDNKSKNANENSKPKVTDTKKENDSQVKKIVSKVKNKKLLYKGLAGLAGFGTGLLLSSVPGIGTIRMGIATTKLVISVSTKKFPEGPITKIVDCTSKKINVTGEKIKNSKIGKSKIGSGAIKAVETIKRFAQSERGECFINGVAAGYITGNIIEFFTKETVVEHLMSDKTSTPTETIATSLETESILEETEPALEETKIPETLETELETETVGNIPGDIEVPVEPNIVPEEIHIETGDILDISELEYGFSSSTSNNAIHLMTEIGKNVEVDKFNTINGETMVHFKQLNGDGYAWFKLSDVQDLLAKTTEIAKNGSMKL